MKNPELKAWCDYPEVDVKHADSGPLAGLTLAAGIDPFQTNLFAVADTTLNPASYTEADVIEVCRYITGAMNLPYVGQMGAG